VRYDTVLTGEGSGAGGQYAINRNLRRQILLQNCAATRDQGRVSVEAASVFGWERYVGDDGPIIGMTTFGASAPIKDLMKKFDSPLTMYPGAREALARARNEP
jgi:hypothetical protein